MPSWIINGNIEEVEREELFNCCPLAGVHACPQPYSGSIAGCRAGARLFFQTTGRARSAAPQESLEEHRERLPPAKGDSWKTKHDEKLPSGCKKFRLGVYSANWRGWMRRVTREAATVSQWILRKLYGGYRGS